MAAIVTFDGVNRVITEISAAGDNELDLFEIYSEWKEWIKLSSANAGAPKAFRFVGGDPISFTEALGSTYFLVNNWKIRPAELDHRLTVVGDLFTDPAGQSPYVPTTGAFTVVVEAKVSALNTVAQVRDIDLMIQGVVGNADVSPDDLTVTILDESLATLRTLSVSADGRTRRII